MDTLEKLKKQRAELDKKIEELESMEQPFDRFQKYYLLTTYGGVTKQVYDDVNLHINNVGQGNAFHTEQEAELEAERRNLLHHFKMFRDKCNAGWIPNWEDEGEGHFYIYYDYDFKEIKSYTDCGTEKSFHLFGYFEEDSDAQKAIELFGDEIKRLYVEV